MMGGSGVGGAGGGSGGGSIDDGDPNTTNIYLGNLPTKISEQQLMEVFGKYGPLASVKVMWPRTDEEKARNRLSGFVAFMSRRDGERALKNLAGKEILGSEIKLGWGKAVPIPAYPVYIPPVMLELTMPPPLSGLPFNGQVERRERGKLPPPGTPYPTDAKGKEEFERVLYSATVKVVMPTDRALLSLIHRMVEFVLREGPMFEAMIMNKEISNPQFRFLFENQSPAHVYYRWKLYSILQGDSTQRWRTEEFRMFRGGSVWRPPKLNPFTQGMPDDLIPEDEREIMVGSLSNAQRTRLERMLRRLTPDRHKVAEVMIFSIEHSESTEEICTCIKESLCNPLTPLQKKIARLYVINDVLHNCTVKGMNAFGYRKGFKAHLPRIFQELGGSYEGVKESGSGGKEGTLGESFKQRVMGCFKAWDEWGVYSSEFLIRLQNIFLGLVGVKDDPAPPTSPTSNSVQSSFANTATIPPDPNKSPGKSDVDEDDDDDEETARANINVHRQKLHKKAAPPRAQLPPQSAMKLVKALQSADEPPEISEELDGVPMDEGEEEGDDGGRLSSAVPSSKFIPSKWEELDPEQVKAGAVTTTSKWDLFEEVKGKEGEEGKGVLVEYEDEDIDGVPMDEEEDDDDGEKGAGLLGEEGRRARLREVEMKVLAFQDELERRGVVGDGVDLVREYREKLLRRVTDRQSSHHHRVTRKGRRRSRSEHDDDGDDDDGGDGDDDRGDGDRSPTTSTTSSSSIPARKRTRVSSSPGNKKKHDNVPRHHHHHHHHQRRSRSNRSRSRSPSQQARRRGNNNNNSREVEEEDVGGRSRSRDRRR